MNLHPLTPRKPQLPAALASIVTFAVIFLLGIAIHFVVIPPVAWLPAADEARTADPAFLFLMLRTLFDEAVFRSDLYSRIDGVLTLPWTVLDTLRFLDLHVSLAIRTAAIILAAMVAGMTAHRLVLHRTLAQPSVRHIKGPRLLDGRAARSALLAAWHRRYGVAEQGIELAKGIPMPRQLETEHFLIAGGTGAGKTTILQSMMHGVIGRGDRMLALDVKGDVTARLPTRNAALLSLDDARSRRWDLGLDVVSREDAEELAIELIPETSDPSWSAGARRVLACLVGYLQDEYGPSARNWSWAELERLLMSPIEVLYGAVLERDPATAIFLDTSQDETRKQAMSFYLVLIANALPVVSACARMGSSRGPGISFRQWVSAGNAPQVLILRQSQRYPELSATIARLGLKFVADAAADRTAQAAPAPVWLMLDELPQIGKTPAVPRLAAIGRSAGIRLVVTVQSPAQLREIYGAEGCQHLLDNLITKIVGRTSSGKTASEISEHWTGKRTVEYWERGARDGSGAIRSERQTDEVAVVEPAFLSDGLGLGSASDGRPIVRALVLGHGDVCLLEWPVGLWRDRRPSTIARSRQPASTSARG
ncbi:helicase HerA-like domain-containing protein [Borborobacter arsenicus]|nr:helicase HerA-like domain-containing protein [Pseudaminobacter arsenicus]